MKNKKIFIIIICVVLIIMGIGTYFYLTKEDKNTSLNIIEKRWIDSNKKQLLDISIFNDVPVLNYHGEGIVFEFLKSLESETGLEFNKISYTLGTNPKSDYVFRNTDIVGENDILMYQDNYVLVTLDGVVYTNPSEIKDITVGVLSKDLDKVNNYLLGSNITYRSFDDATTMINSLQNSVDSINAIVLPKLEYLETILSNENMTIGYNITEYKTYYVLTLSSNNSYNTLNSILTKYYKKWSEKNFEDVFNTYLVNNYFTFTGQESQNAAKFHSKRYIYGFVENKPFDAITDGDLIGINNSIISDFANVSGAIIEYRKYDTIEKLLNAFNANEIDFFLGNNQDTEYKMDIYNSVSPFDEKLVILTNNKKNIIVNSINSLKDYTVSVLKNSKIAEVLGKYDITLKEFNTMEELTKNKKSDVIAIDFYNYQYYVKKDLKRYHLNYITDLDADYKYVFRNVSDNEQFEKIFSFYLTYNSAIPVIYSGIDDTLQVNVLGLIVRNIIVIISCIIVVGIIIFVIKKFTSNKNKNRNNLSKGDKLKYMDQLTSLKNRNYLNDNIEIWDESEVYPQTIVIIDLNDIAYINDNYGHAEGDLVIKEAANILIQNQLANSEIIRTNGNEFLIYLVSYEEKQVVSYIRKLNKEFKELPHGFGAAIGYSVISDAIKTIDDAVNEATLDMRNNKEELSKD